MKFAICIPIGSWNEFLPYTLESLRHQRALTSIALLDASGDERVKDLADRYDEMFSYRRHGPDQGQSDAIIEGWENTDGEFLGWLNADDSLFPGTLEIVEKHIKSHPDLDLVYGHSAIVDEQDRMTGYHFNVERPGDRLLEGCIISQPSCFFRRSTYERIGGLKRELHYTMDWDLWLRLYAAESRFDFIDQPLSRVLWGSDTKSASFNKGRRRELKALIDQYTPDEKKQSIFKAFAIHAGADMIWPAGLRSKTTRWLRRGGQRVFGVRADGEIADGAALNLVHYQSTPARGVVLNFKGDARKLTARRTGLVATSDARQNQLIVDFAAPVTAGQAIDLKLQLNDRSETAPVFFNHAAWLF